MRIVIDKSTPMIVRLGDAGNQADVSRGTGEVLRRRPARRCQGSICCGLGNATFQVKRCSGGNMPHGETASISTSDSTAGPCRGG